MLGNKKLWGWTALVPALGWLSYICIRAYLDGRFVAHLDAVYAHGTFYQWLGEELRKGIVPLWVPAFGIGQPPHVWAHSPFNLYAVANYVLGAVLPAADITLIVASIYYAGFFIGFVLCCSEMEIPTPAAAITGLLYLRLSPFIYLMLFPSNSDWIFGAFPFLCALYLYLRSGSITSFVASILFAGFVFHGKVSAWYTVGVLSVAVLAGAAISQGIGSARQIAGRYIVVGLSAVLISSPSALMMYADYADSNRHFDGWTVRALSSKDVWRGILHMSTSSCISCSRDIIPAVLVLGGIVLRLITRSTMPLRAGFLGAVVAWLCVRYWYFPQVLPSSPEPWIVVLCLPAVLRREWSKATIFSLSVFAGYVVFSAFLAAPVYAISGLIFFERHVPISDAALCLTAAEGLGLVWTATTYRLGGWSVVAGIIAVSLGVLATEYYLPNQPFQSMVYSSGQGDAAPHKHRDEVTAVYRDAERIAAKIRHADGPPTRIYVYRDSGGFGDSGRPGMYAPYGLDDIRVFNDYVWKRYAEFVLTYADGGDSRPKGYPGYEPWRLHQMMGIAGYYWPALKTHSDGTIQYFYGNLVLNVDPYVLTINMLRVLGVEYVLRTGEVTADRGFAEAHPDLTPVLEDRVGRDRIVVYRVSDSVPRAALYSSTTGYADIKDFRASMRTSCLDVRRLAMIEGGVTGSPCQHGPEATAAKIVRYEPNEVVIETSSDSASTLVLSDAYQKGWRATIDGKPTKITPAFYALRSVPAPPGKHTVVFRFRGTIWPYLIAGEFMGFFSLFGLLAVLVTLRWRTRPTAIDHP